MILVIGYFIVPYRKAQLTEAKSCAVEPKSQVIRVRSGSQVSISYHGESTSTKQVEPVEGRVVSYRNVKLFLVTISMATFASSEAIMWAFLPSILQYDSQISAEHAATVLSIIATFFTIGKLSGIICSFYFAPDKMLFLHHSITLISMATFFFWRYDPRMIHISAAFMGFGLSTQWPCLFSMTNSFIGLTSSMCVMFSFVVGLLTLVLPLCLGRYVETNPIVYYFTTFTGQLCSALTFAALKYLVSFVP